MGAELTVLITDWSNTTMPESSLTRVTFLPDITLDFFTPSSNIESQLASKSLDVLLHPNVLHDQ